MTKRIETPLEDDQNTTPLFDKVLQDRKRRIGDIVDEESLLPPIRPAADLLNREMILHSFEWREGENNKYAVMRVSLVEPIDSESEDSEPFLTSCGAETVVKQLRELSQVDDLPMAIRIVKHKETRMLKLV